MLYFPGVLTRRCTCPALRDIQPARWRAAHTTPVNRPDRPPGLSEDRSPPVLRHEHQVVPPVLSNVRQASPLLQDGLLSREHPDSREVAVAYVPTHGVI